MSDKRITNFTDSDFLSFLYSERQREMSLNQVPGWSIWAIVGVWITVLCTGYSILKENQSIRGIEVLYITSAFLAFLLTSSSFFRIAHLRRGIDYSKVKFLEEVVPIIHFIIVFVCASAISTALVITGPINLVFWSWVVLAFVYCVAMVIAFCKKDTIVPSYYVDVVFPWDNVNVYFECILSALYLLIFNASFRKVKVSFLSPEFALSACIASLIALTYFFLKICSKDDVVKRIDEIIEGFLYRGVLKEESFRLLSINRWGYSVIDACSKELIAKEANLIECDNDIKELERIKGIVEMDRVDLDQIGTFLAQLDCILARQEKNLESSNDLTDRIIQVVNAAPLLKDTSELDYLLESSRSITDQVRKLLAQVVDIMGMVKEKHNQVRDLIIKEISENSHVTDE